MKYKTQRNMIAKRNLFLNYLERRGFTKITHRYRLQVKKNTKNKILEITF